MEWLLSMAAQMGKYNEALSEGEVPDLRIHFSNLGFLTPFFFYFPPVSCNSVNSRQFRCRFSFRFHSASFPSKPFQHPKIIPQNFFLPLIYYG